MDLFKKSIDPNIYFSLNEKFLNDIYGSLNKNLFDVFIKTFFFF